MDATARRRDRAPDGSQGIYTYVEKPDFALIIPVEHDGFHLVEQYRYPVSHRSWEFPQGTLPDRKDADPEAFARRELAEETGLRVGRLKQLGHLYPAKGMSSQAFTVFVADQLEVGEHSREQEEQDMRQSWFSRHELENMIRAVSSPMIPQSPHIFSTSSLREMATPTSTRSLARMSLGGQA